MVSGEVDTWPHEYVLGRKDGQRVLIELVCPRFRAGEGVAGTDAH